MHFPSEHVRASHTKAQVNQNLRKHSNLCNFAVTVSAIYLADLMLNVKRSLKKQSIQYLILIIKNIVIIENNAADCAYLRSRL